MANKMLTDLTNHCFWILLITHAISYEISFRAISQRMKRKTSDTTLLCIRQGQKVELVFNYTTTDTEIWCHLLNIRDSSFQIIIEKQSLLTCSEKQVCLFPQVGQFVDYFQYKQAADHLIITWKHDINHLNMEGVQCETDKNVQAYKFDCNVKQNPPLEQQDPSAASTTHRFEEKTEKINSIQEDVTKQADSKKQTTTTTTLGKASSVTMNIGAVTASVFSVTVCWYMH